MFERYRDLTPDDDDIVLLPVVPVNDGAVHGLAGYGELNRRTYDQDTFRQRLQEFPELYFAMGLFCEEWELEDEGVEFFEFGFAFTFAAIANQAEIAELPLDDITETAVESVAGYIQTFGGSGTKYLLDQAAHLQTLNSNLTDEWLKCLRTHGLSAGDELGQDFIIGGILCHHLLRDSINQDELLATYIAGVN